MNFNVNECLNARPRCRYHWLPLISQQLRLRHLYQISACNLISTATGRFYYTMHLTDMSAPFYTSEKSEFVNAKWPEIHIVSLPYLSNTAFVLRIWEEQESSIDLLVTTIGVHLSGLVYLGSKAFNIQPEHFIENSVIFTLRGGYFTSHSMLRTDLTKPPPFIDYVNVISSENCTAVFRYTCMKCSGKDLKNSFNIAKLQRIHSLQIQIRNKRMDARNLEEEINKRIGLTHTTNVGGSEQLSMSPESSRSVRYEPQLLTMNTLNRMLRGPTHLLILQSINISKLIEVAKFRTRLLTRERDKRLMILKRLKETKNKLMDKNEEENSKLMASYHALNRNKDKFKEWKITMSRSVETFSNLSVQLHHRRRQLMLQLLSIYPIVKVNDDKYIIHGVYLPNSDLLTDCSDGGLSVALGYVTHLLIMCSIFLQIPLRHPMIHYGCRSYIIDNVPPSDRKFALFKINKERLQFNFAVFLLNRNIAQLRFSCGLHTPDLKATLPNLLGLLQGKGYQTLIDHFVKRNVGNSKTQHEKSSADEAQTTSTFSSSNFEGSLNLVDPILESLSHEYLSDSGTSAKSADQINSTKLRRRSDLGPGLSDILAVSEPFKNLDNGSGKFKQYLSAKSQNDLCDDSVNTATEANICDFNNTLKAHDKESVDVNFVECNDNKDDKCDTTCHKDVNTLVDKTPKEENSAELDNSNSVPLVERTNALRNTKSFNLVEPKF